MRRVGALGVLIATVVACSGGGGGGLTRVEYVRRANAVCRDAGHAVADLQVPRTADGDALAAASAAVVEIQRRALEGLRSLPEPAPDRAALNRWLALVDQTLDQSDASVRAQRSGDVQAALTANANGEALDRRADELARRFGLTSCVQAASLPAP